MIGTWHRKPNYRRKFLGVAVAAAMIGATVVIGGPESLPAPAFLGVAFNKYEVFSENLAEKVHNLDTDTLKVALSNTAPNAATHALLADITEITAQNGYAAGGADTQNATSRSGGTTSITGVDVVFTASGGSFGPFRYVVLYNDTPASPLRPLIGWWDYGSSISTNNGETFTVDFGTSMFTLA